jgi:hypothetical protein
MWRLELDDVDNFEMPRQLYVAHFNLPAYPPWRHCSAHGGVRAAARRSLNVFLHDGRFLFFFLTYVRAARSLASLLFSACLLGAMAAWRRIVFS